MMGCDRLRGHLLLGASELRFLVVNIFFWVHGPFCTNYSSLQKAWFMKTLVVKVYLRPMSGQQFKAGMSGVAGQASAKPFLSNH